MGQHTLKSEISNKQHNLLVIHLSKPSTPTPPFSLPYKIIPALPLLPPDCHSPFCYPSPSPPTPSHPTHPPPDAKLAQKQFHIKLLLILLGICKNEVTQNHPPLPILIQHPTSMRSRDSDGWETDSEHQKGRKKVNYGEDQKIKEKEEAGRLDRFIKNDKTVEILKKKGVKCLFPVQYMTYDIVYSGQDLMARDKTGSGKTLAFALPIIERMRKDGTFGKNHLPKFVVVLPTRELALQVKDEIESLKYREGNDFRVIAVYGKSDIRAQMDTIKRGIDIIVGTPGRLIDLLEKDVVKMNELQVLCLDEADEMLKIGFKEAIERIYEYITKNAPKKPQNLLFSATIPPWVKDISQTYQDSDCKFINLIKEEELTTPLTLTHYALRLPKNEELYRARVISNLLKKYAVKAGNAIIFCERKADVDRLSNALGELGLKGEALHGDVPQSSRERAYRNFKAGTLKFIIATNVAARGLDFPEIDMVIQVEPPRDVESYIHRSGRTARRGQEGICVTIYNDSNERMVKNIEREANIRMKQLTSDQFMKKGGDRRDDRDRNERDRNDSRNDRDRNDRDRNDSKGYSRDKGDSRNGNDGANDRGEYEVFAKFLPNEKSESQIRDYFQDKGMHIKTIKLLRTDGEFKGSAFLKFTSKKDRDNCLDLDGDSWQGRKMSLTLPREK